ncbi:Crp/Fnr family transcriptional regulator [Carboxylicivirga sp. A043]|uniref:Crp/Fnr family transcriptional regulator n=1 Tax=Carboxylicivirga litoralis TaxID=2816963 RepID=UPI0021CB3B0C|nr:Crp/Fnr family transcriptional regulator [Carboxylicivirga sp. A043]MCU4158077.1 Crp/Fnr family transcriptional regulator [Carboxylicivirga sp. A043]
METQKIVEHIRRFVPLSNREQNVLDRNTKRLSLEQHKFLIQKGDISNSIYFVEKGCLRMYSEKTKSIELTTQLAIEGWWLTDFFSFIDNKPSEHFIQTLEESEIISIDKVKYQELLKEIPQLHDYFVSILQRNIAASQLRIKYLFEMSPEDLLQHFTTSFPDFVSRVPLSMIYSYLGISHDGNQMIS